MAKVRLYRPDSTLLVGTPDTEDKVTIRKMKLLKDNQIKLFCEAVLNCNPRFHTCYPG